MFMRWMTRGTCVAAGLLILAAMARAEQDAFVQSSLVTSADSVEQALATSNAHATTQLRGMGSALRIAYGAAAPLTVFMIPLNTDDQTFDPTDAFTFTLPSGSEQQATVDLRVSPAWSPRPITYIVHVLSPSADTKAGFSQTEFLPAGTADVLTAIWMHVLTPELFVPSTMHVLRGGRVLGHSLTIIVGMLTLLACLCIAIRSRRHTAQRIGLVLISVMMLYGMRFSVDLLRFTNDHLRSWYKDGTYGAAGSVYDIAADLREPSLVTSPVVLLCRDGSNYREKLLRYLVYPLRISTEDRALAQTTSILVMDKIRWSYDDASHTLHCGTITVQAKHVAAFTDGSELFSRLPST